MSVLVKTLSDIIALLLQALRLSVVLPAIVIVGLNTAFVWPMFEGTNLFAGLTKNGSAFPQLLILGLMVLLIAYFLSVLNIPIIRFFEGYTWLPTYIGRRLRLSHFRRIHFLETELNSLDANIKKRHATLKKTLQQAEVTQDLDEAAGLRANSIHDQYELRALEMQKNLIASELILNYPSQQTWRVLPTKLGNVIASAEEYSGHLYGLDSVTMWPFLVPILSDRGYASFIEREKATFDFLLNMSVITVVFGFELFYVDILLSRFHLGYSVTKLLIAILVAFLFYITSIQGALAWGHTIRTALVMFRDDLRVKLGIAAPSKYYDERFLWKQASRFFRDHDVTPGNYIFDYGADHPRQARDAEA